VLQNNEPAVRDNSRPEANLSNNQSCTFTDSASRSQTLFAPLPAIDGGWRCVLADPPWQFLSNSKANPGRNAMRHYGCLSLDEIASLPLEEVVAKDALLWLWVPGPFLAVGAHVAVMRGWGFEPTAIGFVWVKLNRNAPELFTHRNDLFMGPGLTEAFRKPKPLWRWRPATHRCAPGWLVTSPMRDGLTKRSSGRHRRSRNRTARRCQILQGQSCVGALSRRPLRRGH
jgi:hypothetical protein